MKQIWPNYSYSPTTNVLTLTGLNIDRDQLLLVSAPERGRIMYNFADSTVTASAFTAGANTRLTLVASTAGLTTTAALVIYYDDQVSGISGTVTANIGSAGRYDNGGDSLRMDLMAVRGQDSAPWLRDGGGNVPISGTVTANLGTIGGIEAAVQNGIYNYIDDNAYFPISGTVAVGNTVTIGGGTVTIGAGTAQIGSVTASISNFPATQAISIASVTIGNSVTIGSLPAISGTVTANIAISSTAITSGSFTSLTSATLVPANTARKMATVYNLGAGQLFVNAGSSATTLGGGFMVALSSGDFFECDYTTTTLSAIFATAGTASWVSH